MTDQEHQISHRHPSGNTYDLEDILTYVRCPLAYKYRAWGARAPAVDLRQAIETATRDAIRAYLNDGMRENSTPSTALDRAAMTYKKTLIQYDKAGIFEGDMKFAEHFNFGLVLLRKFHMFINPNYDRPIAGFSRCGYELSTGDVVVGDFDGCIAFNIGTRSDTIFGIVSVGKRPRAKSTYDRMREGFGFGVMKASTSGLRTPNIEIVNVNPESRTIKRYPMTADDKAVFESVSKAAIRGIQSDVYVPQPTLSNCRLCPYDKACKLKYCEPENKRWQRKEFLGSLGH